MKRCFLVLMAALMPAVCVAQPPDQNLFEPMLRGAGFVDPPGDGIVGNYRIEYRPWAVNSTHSKKNAEGTDIGPAVNRLQLRVVPNAQGGSTFAQGELYDWTFSSNLLHNPPASFDFPHRYPGTTWVPMLDGGEIGEGRWVQHNMKYWGIDLGPHYKFGMVCWADKNGFPTMKIDDVAIDNIQGNDAQFDIKFTLGNMPATDYRYRIFVKDYSIFTGDFWRQAAAGDATDGQHTVNNLNTGTAGAQIGHLFFNLDAMVTIENKHFPPEFNTNGTLKTFIDGDNRTGWRHVITWREANTAEFIPD